MNNEQPNHGQVLPSDGAVLCDSALLIRQILGDSCQDLIADKSPEQVVESYGLGIFFSHSAEDQAKLEQALRELRVQRTGMAREADATPVPTPATLGRGFISNTVTIRIPYYPPREMLLLLNILTPHELREEVEGHLLHSYDRMAVKFGSRAAKVDLACHLASLIWLRVVDLAQSLWKVAGS